MIRFFPNVHCVNLPFQQNQTPKLREKLGWDILGKSVYNNDAFHDLGRRCLYIAVQSADVERSCKAHGLIHTQVKNRLKNKLYLYVNLRLLKKMEAPPDNFLSEILSSTQK